MLGARVASAQFAIASPKSAMWRVCAASRRPRRVNSQVSSEWKRTVPRRGEPDPWWSTIIQASPLRSSFATKTLKPGWGSSLPAYAPIGPKAGMPVRPKKRNARGFDPCSWPNAQP
jgi:hypothetical protein